jgi:hypothetical protein
VRAPARGCHLHWTVRRHSLTLPGSANSPSATLARSTWTLSRRVVSHPYTRAYDNMLPSTVCLLDLQALEHGSTHACSCPHRPPTQHRVAAALGLRPWPATATAFLHAGVLTQRLLKHLPRRCRQWYMRASPCREAAGTNELIMYNQISWTHLIKLLG